MTNQSQVLVGLTKYALVRDETTRLMIPAIPDDPGIIHALRPSHNGRPLLETHFIENTEDYRAAICGAKVKVVLPLSFKPGEDGACSECIEELSDGSPTPTVSLSMPVFHKPGGDAWWSHGALNNPGYKRRREAELRERQATQGPQTAKITFT